MKTVITVSGIRPDFIRMSAIFKKLDEDVDINHILVHTGQHYDELLSGVFFKELEIRKPDYILDTGKQGGTHYNQLGYLSVAIMELIKKQQLKPNIILFLGDSNTVCAALPLRKEGYIIGHIEAGMRSYDNRMLEEINRVVCDKCSDFLFVYHNDYKKNLLKENIKKNVYVVGNTIIEPCKKILSKISKKPLINQKYILVDIHRPENFLYKERLRKIVEYCSFVRKTFKSKILFLKI